MSMKSEEDCFEPDMEEEFAEEVEEDDEEVEQKSDESDKGKKNNNGTPVKNQGNTVDRYFWVDNIKPGTKTDKVQDLFKKHGKVLAVKVIRGGSDGNLLAFIKFDTPADAQKCMDNLDNTEFQGNTLKIIRERPNAPEDSKPDKRPVRRNFSPKRSFSPRRYQNRNGGGGGGDRGFRGSGSGGFQGGRRGDLRSGGGGFRDGGFQDHRGGRSFIGGGDRLDRFDRFARDREEDRRTRELEMRREKEFFDLEKERLEVERLKLKREREELEKLSVEMNYDRFDKRQKSFNDSFDSGRRFDDFRRDDMKRSDRFSPERDSRPISRFTSGSSLGGSIPSARPAPSFSSSGGRDRSYEQQKSWQSSSWDAHETSSQQPGRSSWQSSSNFASNSSSSHNDRGRYNNGSSSSSAMASGQRISSSGNDRNFGSSFGSSSSGHRRY